MTPAPEPLRRRALAAGSVVLAIVAGLLLTGGNPTGIVLPPPGPPLREPEQTALTVAHRGDQVRAPENTLPAFEAAFEVGADLVEADVRLSRDREPVIIHDATLDRTTDGHGLVAARSLAELRRLDAGGWFDPRYRATPIPMLTELLDLLAEQPGRSRLMLELKGSWRAAEVSGMVEQIHERGLRDRVVVGSFSPVTLSFLLQAAPDIPRVVIRHTLPADAVRWARMAGASAFLTTPGSLASQRDQVVALREAGIDVLVYTLNERAAWRRAVALDADGIISDVAASLRPWMIVHARADGVVVGRVAPEREIVAVGGGSRPQFR